MVFMFQTSYEGYCRNIELFPNIPNFFLFRMKRGNKDDGVLRLAKVLVFG